MFPRHPYASTHLSLRPDVSGGATTHLPPVRLLRSADLTELCAIDEKLMRKRVAHEASEGRTAVAVMPDVESLEWHHAREDFVGKELYDKIPEFRGAVVGTEPGTRVWCTWTRMWYNSDPKDAKGNTLHILRLVIEDPGYIDYEAASEKGAVAAKSSVVAAATAALLAAAQDEASRWNMGEIDIWNPTSATLAAGRMLDSSVQITDRQKDSISSLRWYGEGKDCADTRRQVEWLGNEKYAWC